MNENSKSLKNWRIGSQHAITQSALNADLTAHCTLPNYHQRWSAARYQRQESWSRLHPCGKQIRKHQSHNAEREITY